MQYANVPLTTTGVRVRVQSTRYLAFLLALYLGIGPVYWVPGVSPEIFDVVKTLLFIAVVMGAVLGVLRSKRIYFPGGPRIFLLLSALLFMAVPGAIIGERAESIDRLQNSLQILMFVMACGYISKHQGWMRTIVLAVRIFLVFSLASAVTILVAPDIPNPFNSDLAVSETGFGGSRTGWSPANALYLPWLGVSSVLPGGAWLLAAAVAILVGNQILVMGRAGILASAVILIVSQALSRKLTKVIAAVILLPVLYGLTLVFSEDLRIAGMFDSGGLSFDLIEEVTTGRASQYYWAAQVLFDKPIAGLGFGNALAGDGGMRIHNDFLMLLVEGGIIYGLIAISVVAVALLKGLNAFRSGDPIARAAFLTVVAGTVVAQFEPGFIFGNFNNSCFWWFCFSICVTSNKSMKRAD